MASYYEVTKKKKTAKCCSSTTSPDITVQIGIIYGDLEIIKSHYTSKGITVQVNPLSIIDEDAESKAVPYSKKIWRYTDIYVVADSSEEALMASKLYCVKEGVEFNQQWSSLQEYNVVKCESIDGVPKFTL